MAEARPPSAGQIIRSAVAMIRDRLPGGWSVSEPERSSRSGNTEFVISSPDGRSVRAVIGVKTGQLTGREVSAAASELRTRVLDASMVPVLTARYLSPQAREALRASGVSFVDLTANISIVSAAPGLYLADRGADKDPWRGAGRPRASLKGEPAMRVVRALLDQGRAWRVRELVAASGASTGATYRVLQHLDDEGLAERGEDGVWQVPDWERLLRAWAEDYRFLTENTVSRFIAPRGLGGFRSILSESQATYAVTGAAAAEEWASVAPTKSMFVYVEDAARDAAAWGLRATDAGVNVVLIEPRTPDSTVFRGVGRLEDGVWRAAPAQVAVDLLNGPGRDPQEGEELLRWMRENEAAWRLS